LLIVSKSHAFIYVVNTSFSKKKTESEEENNVVYGTDEDQEDKKFAEKNLPKSKPKTKMTDYFKKL
tara:strand:- start:256 stop:453 length:198 start_codon:yes stop_codon:yes gene_type:complete